MVHTDISAPQYNNEVVMKGWQCPVCKAVMAPTTLACISCKPQPIVTSSIPAWYGGGMVST